MHGQPMGRIHGHTPFATQFPGHGCIYDLTTELSFDSQATWVIDVFGFLFDMIFISVCTTRDWQTSGRLVQNLNVCTVAKYCLSIFNLCMSGFKSQYNQNRFFLLLVIHYVIKGFIIDTGFKTVHLLLFTSDL